MNYVTSEPCPSSVVFKRVVLLLMNSEVGERLFINYVAFKETSDKNIYTYDSYKGL